MPAVNSEIKKLNARTRFLHAVSVQDEMAACGLSTNTHWSLCVVLACGRKDDWRV